MEQIQKQIAEQMQALQAQQAQQGQKKGGKGGSSKGGDDKAASSASKRGKQSTERIGFSWSVPRTALQWVGLVEWGLCASDGLT